MRCDRCGRNIVDGPMVTMGAKRPYRNLCRTCWSVETRNSNTRLISALNEMTRRLERRAAEAGDASAGPPEGRGKRRRGGGAGAARPVEGEASPDEVEDRRHDPDRPHWHL